MAYIKTTWEDGDTITAQGLNNIENGIETLDQNTIDDLCDFVIQQDSIEDTITATKGTFNSIYTALQTKPVFGVFKFKVSSGTQIWSHYIPITYVVYYPSGDVLSLFGIYYEGNNVSHIHIEWENDNSISRI